MRRLAWVVCLAVLAGTGCGGDSAPDHLNTRDAQTLNHSRSDIGDALDTEETIRTSKQAATRLRAKVQKTVGMGSFENGKPDEFGLAALGELRTQVPSLVNERPDGTVYALDTRAARDFLSYSVSDPARALQRPVDEEVATIEQALKRSKAGAKTKVQTPDASAPSSETVSGYLREIEGDLRARYPREAARIRTAREAL